MGRIKMFYPISSAKPTAMSHPAQITIYHCRPIHGTDRQQLEQYKCYSISYRWLKPNGNNAINLHIIIAAPFMGTENIKSQQQQSPCSIICRLNPNGNDAINLYILYHCRPIHGTENMQSQQQCCYQPTFIISSLPTYSWDGLPTACQPSVILL